MAILAARSISNAHCRWPQSLFQTPTPILFQNFCIWIRFRKFFKFENSTPVQTSDTIEETENYQWFYFRNDHANSCYYRNWKVTPDSGPVFEKILAPGPDPREKRRILRESPPALRIHGHLWWTPEVAGVTFSDSDSAPIPKFSNLDRIRVRKFFKFGNLTPVTPVTNRSNQNSHIEKWLRIRFSQKFNTPAGSERKTWNPARVDSGNPRSRDTSD